MYEKVKECDYTFDDEIWDEYSKESKDFIAKILVPYSRDRMTMEQIMAHTWLQLDGFSGKVNEKRQVNIKSYASRRVSKKAA